MGLTDDLPTYTLPWEVTKGLNGTEAPTPSPLLTETDPHCTNPETLACLKAQLPQNVFQREAATQPQTTGLQSGIPCPLVLSSPPYLL